MFTDYGMPVTFYNDHYDLLLSQDYVFARKISPEAKDLKDRLGRLYASGREDFKVSNEGRKLFDFLTGRGRIGRRFAPPLLGDRDQPGPRTRTDDRRLQEMARRQAPDRGRSSITPTSRRSTICSTKRTRRCRIWAASRPRWKKRTRHRRALMRMLFDYYDTDRLIICLDTANLDLDAGFLFRPVDHPGCWRSNANSPMTTWSAMPGGRRPGGRGRPPRKPWNSCCRRSATTWSMKASASERRGFPSHPASAPDRQRRREPRRRLRNSCRCLRDVARGIRRNAPPVRAIEERPLGLRL